MKFSITLLIFAVIQGGLGVALKPRDDPPGAKVQALEPKYFKELGAKRVKITYGPMVVPGIDDEETQGMKSFLDYNALMPCKECLVTGYVPDLQYADGKTANANTGMWLHHIGLMNLNRTDAACTEWPDRFIANGNERSPVDMTLGGTRKGGYYLRENDQVFFATDIMNESELDRTVYLTMEWEYVEGIPEGFDVVIPVWLNVKGNCLNESMGVGADETVFNATTNTGWTPQFSGDLFLLTGHVHDGNTKQEIYMDGKKICENLSRYGENEAFVTHVGMYGHEKNSHEHEHDEDGEEDGEHHHDEGDEEGGEHHHDEGDEEGGEHHHDEGDEEGSEHDHSSSDHIMHISSITECTNIGMISPKNKFTITSFYDMTLHPGMMGHDGEAEPIMGIEFLHIARPKDEAIRDIIARGQGDLASFQRAVRGE